MTHDGHSPRINNACVGVAFTWLALFVVLVFGAILTSGKTPIQVGDDSDQTASMSQE